MSEQLVNLAEARFNLPVAEDPGRWTLIGPDQRTLTEEDRTDHRAKARRLVRENPHARQILQILESYVAGPGLAVKHTPDDAAADDAWQRFLDANADHYSFREHARRVWRDGEAFLRVFPTAGAPQVRFIDPEEIAGDAQHPESQGILTSPRDVENRTHYLRIDRVTGELQERIPAHQVRHTRINADSNEKRGLTLFAPIEEVLECYKSWYETELTARRLQASIVLWRKVQGSPQAIESLAESLKRETVSTPTPGRPNESIRYERFRPGTILTTNHATEIEFLQPRTNLRDSVPLGRMLLLAAAAGVGLPEFMLTSDASNANYASTMIAEGPAVKIFQAWQQFFAQEFTAVWRLVMGRRITRPEWKFPDLVNRDRHQEREADARLVELKILSRAEAARRDGADPDEMRREIEAENDLDPEPDVQLDLTP